MPRLPALPLALVLAALVAQSAVAQEQPKQPKDAGKGPRIKMGSDGEQPPPEQKPPDEPSKPAEKSEPEQWIDQLATWPSADAKQASIRLATEPTVSYPLLERKMLEANLDWRMVAGVSATFGKIRDLRAIELIRAKLEDKKMYQHASDLLDALVRIDPVGAKQRLLALLLHPASAVVNEVEKLLEARVGPSDVDALRDVYDAGGPAARVAAIRLAAKADRVAARADLVRGLRDAEPDVAFAAASALAADDTAEARDLTLRSALTPIDRQFAYATISLALRAERGGSRDVDDAAVRTLLGGRGLKSLDQLPRASAALLLADLGYFHEVPVLDEPYDRMVVPVLIDSWVGREFWADMKVVQPLAVRRLRRLTGKLDFNSPQEWAAWWEQEGSKFTARRVLLAVPEELASTMVFSIEGPAAPGGEATTITASPVALDAQSADELVLLVTPAEASALAKTVNESGVLHAPESPPTQGRTNANTVTATVRVGKRERRSTVRTDAGDAGADRLVAAVADLRARLSWQRYRTDGNAVDAQSFLAAMSPAFSPDRPEEDRAASLAGLIVQALDDRRGPAWNLRALRELETMPRLATALGPAEVERLLSSLDRRSSLDEVAQAIIRTLAKTRKPEVTPRLLDFLVAHATPDARALIVTVLRNAPREQFVAAFSDGRYDVRIAAFEAVDRATLDDAVAARILKAVDDKDRGVGGEALRALGRLRVEDARPLIAHLAEEPGELRAAAVESLGLLGGRESLSTIMTAYASDDVTLRVAAILSLASTREPEGLSAIVFAMNSDPSNLVREVASRAIVDMGTDRAAAELRKLAIDPAQRPASRASALSSYAQVAGRGATPDLTKLLEDGSDDVSDAAALGLARWREPAAVPHLISMLEKERNVRAVRQALESISLEAFAPRDPKMLADLYGGWWELSKDRGPKGWLLDAVTAQGGEDAALRAWAQGDSGRQVVPSLVKALRNDKWYVRRAADLALRDLLGKKVGDQDPWTTPGEVSRMAEAWEQLWAETLGK